MPRIVVIGGGIVGLSMAMMLAKQGHEVIVLERDGGPGCPAGWLTPEPSRWPRKPKTPGSPTTRATSARRTGPPRNSSPGC